MAEEELDYRPRPERAVEEGPAERREDVEEYTPRRKKTSRREKRRRPARWQREQAKGRRSSSSDGGRFFGSKLFWRLAAIVAVIVMVVPTTLMALVGDEPAVEDPQLAELLARLEQDPDDFATLVELGNYHYELGLSWSDRGDDSQALDAFEAAAAYYERALRQDPADSGVRTDLGTMHYYQGLLRDDPALTQQAIQEWQVALSYEPNRPETLLNLGIGYLVLDEVGQAVAVWQMVIEIAPGSEHAQQARQLIEQYGGR